MSRWCVHRSHGSSRNLSQGSHEVRGHACKDTTIPKCAGGRFFARIAYGPRNLDGREETGRRPGIARGRGFMLCSRVEPTLRTYQDLSALRLPERDADPQICRGYSHCPHIAYESSLSLIRWPVKDQSPILARLPDGAEREASGCVVGSYMPLNYWFVGRGVNGQSRISSWSWSNTLILRPLEVVAGEAAQFIFGDVEPTAVLGRVAELQPPDVSAGKPSPAATGRALRRT